MYERQHLPKETATQSGTSDQSALLGADDLVSNAHMQEAMLAQQQGDADSGGRELDMSNPIVKDANGKPMFNYKKPAVGAGALFPGLLLDKPRWVNSDGIPYAEEDEEHEQGDAVIGNASSEVSTAVMASGS